MLVLFQNAQPLDAQSVAAAGSVRLVDQAIDLPNVVGAGGFATDGDDNNEAQLQQQLDQQLVQQDEQQDEVQQQLDLQQAQQDEQQAQLTEQQATGSVPGS